MSRYQTQWAAQFFAAAELTRRGYLVSLTAGNAKFADLLVVSPNGVHFMVDVKGLAAQNFWLIKERPVTASHFYILVLVGEPPAVPTFFVLSATELMREVVSLKDQTLARGKPWKASGAGINWGTALLHKDKWSILPQ